MAFSTCPRCQYRSLEQLRTHAFCANCDFSPDLLPFYDQKSQDLIPNWAYEALEKTLKKRKGLVHYDV